MKRITIDWGLVITVTLSTITLIFIMALVGIAVIGILALGYKMTDEDTSTETITPVIEVAERNIEDIEIPCNEDFSAKTYMDYRKITNEGSSQYQYIHNSGEISVDDKGFLITEDGYIGAALGSYFGEIGSKYIFTLDTGREIKVVKVEEKADIHTCEHNVMAGSNDLIEFVIDSQTEYMQENIYSNGLVFQGNFNNCFEFEGDIVKIQKIKED